MYELIEIFSFSIKRVALYVPGVNMSSSSKILDQHCAICDRERRQSLRSISTSSLDLGGTTAAKLNTLLNNKYRDLPVIKGDEFYTQVSRQFGRQ